jgi:hypothetical protein
MPARIHAHLAQKYGKQCLMGVQHSHHETALFVYELEQKT